jgi:hypothetical protein
MKNDPPNQRRYPRYETDVQVYFKVEFDFETKLQYQQVDKVNQHAVGDKHPATSKNVSVEGIAFNSSEQLKEGDVLNLEVFLPGGQSPIYMRGVVRWSSMKEFATRSGKSYDTGVKLMMVNGQPVGDTIYFDAAHQVYWSNVLESILGEFKQIGQKRSAQRTS